MNELPVILAVLNIAAYLHHLLLESLSMSSSTTISQTTLLWAYKELKLWNRRVQGPGVQYVVVGVVGELVNKC
jgi:hypothetical protein